MKKYALIADDDKVARLIHGNLLINMGYTVVEAENGKEAICQFLAHQEELDVILMDYNMPEINGMTAAQEIRHIENASAHTHTLIVGITADASSATKIACINAGMNAVMSKPIVVSELEKYISESKA